MVTEGSGDESASVDASHATGVQIGTANTQNINNSYYIVAPAGQSPTATRISNLPRPNPHFTGRAELLTRLSELLDDGPVAVVALHGLGGVGKTQLAQEYANAGADKYAITWWISSDSEVIVTAELVRLAQVLGLGAEGDRAQALIDALRAELAGRSDWLLVFDNVNQADVVRKYLPPGNGHVLITSRTRHWTGMARTCSIEEFTDVEAVDYLRRAGPGKDAPELVELADELGRLPLALAQAAGYLTVHDCSAAHYLRLYRAATRRILEAGPTPHGYPATVATTWLLHFDAMSHPAGALLRLFSFLAPDAIPVDLLLDSATGDSLPTLLRDVAADPVVREEVIGELVDTSLFTRLDDRTVRVHRLVQEITRAGLDQPVAATWLSQATELVRASIPPRPQDTRHWERMRALVPHAQRTAMLVGPDQEGVRSAVFVLHGLALYLNEQEQFDPAREAIERALGLAQISDAFGNAELAGLLLMQGNILFGLRDHQGARAVIERATAMLESADGPAHLEQIKALLALAASHNSTGEFDAAFVFTDQAMTILANAPDLPPEIWLVCLEMAGEALRTAGYFAEAQQFLDQALTLATRLRGPDSQEVAHVRVILGWLYGSRGDHAKAETQISRAIEIIGTTFGPDHTFTRRLIARRDQWRANQPST